MLSDRAYESLRKYKVGAILDENDRYFVETWQNIGFANIGFTIRSPNKFPQETAKLTPTGQSIIEEEEIFRNPIKRFFHFLFYSLF